MKIRLLPSTTTAETQRIQYLTSITVNDNVCVDAGSIGLYGTAEQQTQYHHLFLSHTHLDHLASLPIYLDNAIQTGQVIKIYGEASTLQALQSDFFNDRIWPDFIEINRKFGKFMDLIEVTPEVSFEAADLHVTPVRVDHVVPTLGFILSDSSGEFVIVSDTGPTERIWELANRLPRLQGVMLEVSFPAGMEDLGAISKHLTSSTFATEIKKLRVPEARILAVHLKACYRERIVAELAQIPDPRLEVCIPGSDYVF